MNIPNHIKKEDIDSLVVVVYLKDGTKFPVKLIDASNKNITSFSMNFIPTFEPEDDEFSYKLPNYKLMSEKFEFEVKFGNGILL